MTKICLLFGLALLCGCGHHYTPPIAGVDTTVPRPVAVSLPPTASDEASSSSPATEPVRAEEPVPSADFNPSFDSSGGSRSRGSEAERVTAVNSTLQDVYFAYNKVDLSPDAAAALRHDAEVLRGILHDFPQLRVTVEGHCDERGSAEYNLALGDRRAARTIESLSQFGLPAVSFAPVSYGKEEPQCVEANEACWSRNRRAHFVVRSTATM